MSGRREPRPLGTRTAVVCSVADQGVTAATNIAVLVVAARLSSAGDFAVFTMAYMTATVLLGLSAAYLGQALVLERGAGVPGACRSAAAFAAIGSAAVGVPAAAVLGLVPGGTGDTFTALALVLPVVVPQDTLRYCCSALRLPHLALTADLLRLAVTLPVLAVQPSGASPARLIALWGVAAAPALVVGGLLVARRTRGAPVRPGRYLRRGHLGRRFAVEFGVGNGSSQLAVVALGVLADPLAVGALRGAATLFGPLNVLCNSATAFGPPLLGRVPGVRGRKRAGAGLAVLIAAAAVGWTCLFLLVPDAFGRQVLGDTWQAASALLPATGTQSAAIAAGTCGLLTLRVLRPRATLPLQVVFSLTAVALLAAGYVLGGVTGAAWGLCAGSLLKAAALWTRVARLPNGPDRDHGDHDDGGEGDEGDEGDDHDDSTRGGDHHDPAHAAGIHRGGL